MTQEIWTETCDYFSNNYAKAFSNRICRHCKNLVNSIVELPVHVKTQYCVDMNQWQDAVFLQCITLKNEDTSSSQAHFEIGNKRCGAFNTVARSLHHHSLQWSRSTIESTLFHVHHASIYALYLVSVSWSLCRLPGDSPLRSPGRRLSAKINTFNS